ncbi:MAG: hypothetical protein IPL46_21085 [Saprospiraceae bacterium]|nr:hypothetical protein [Saprospiraceae bacterium]
MAFYRRTEASLKQVSSFITLDEVLAVLRFHYQLRQHIQEIGSYIWMAFQIQET